MKYWYFSDEEQEIIKNYSVEDDKIIITYLDNSIKIMNNTKENFDMIINLMIEQATQYVLLDEAFNKKDLKTYKSIFGIGILYLSTNGLLPLCFDVKDLRNIFIAFLVSGSILTIVSAFAMKETNNRINDIEKYKIFLQMINNNNLEKFDSNLNINTLDNYSLKDIKNIELTLKRSKDFRK